MVISTSATSQNWWGKKEEENIDLNLRWNMVCIFWSLMRTRWWRKVIRMTSENLVITKIRWFQAFKIDPVLQILYNAQRGRYRILGREEEGPGTGVRFGTLYVSLSGSSVVDFVSSVGPGPCFFNWNLTAQMGTAAPKNSEPKTAMNIFSLRCFMLGRLYMCSAWM